ncbi:MAG: 50S ribosomal protein L11 [Rickettsiales bacterium]
MAPAPAKAVKKGNKKVEAFVKLQIKGGAATPAPPVGPALGQKGVNIKQFCDAFNEATSDRRGDVLPVVISVYGDKSFTFIVKQPPASSLIMKAANLAKGSGETGKEVVGSISTLKLAEIAKRKMEDMNARHLEAAISMLRGTALSMGLEVKNENE